MTLFQELKKRNLIAQVSHEKEVEELLGKESVKFYTGFDATADSLHIGGLLQLVTMRRFQKAGHIPFALLGTATSLIGDPTGKTELRKMLTPEEIDHNCARFREQMGRIIDFTPGAKYRAEVVKNGDWFKDIGYLDFIGEIGRHFSVNKMLTAECFRSRYEGKGLSFLEFNYMLLQSYDFLHLYRKHGVRLQMGGDDQWSNILAGADLVRRVEQGETETARAFALTFKLITTSTGQKMGKTEKGALWLDADKCSPYDFYQYFRNVDDADVINLLHWLTFVPLEEIEERENWCMLKEGAKINQTKELLACEMTELVHGLEEAKKAKNAAKSVFFGSGESADMPTTTLADSDFDDDYINIVDLLVKTNLCSSRRDARTNIEQGGISVADEKIIDTEAKVLIQKDSFVIIKKGKKTHLKVMRG
jgi:tyrosyl-tRNA synthetase